MSEIDSVLHLPVIARDMGHGGEVRLKESGLGVAWCGNNCQASMDGAIQVDGYAVAKHIADLWNASIEIVLELGDIVTHPKWEETELTVTEVAETWIAFSAPGDRNRYTGLVEGFSLKRRKTDAGTVTSEGA